MSTIRVIPVSTREERRCFLELPWQLYRDDPQWVPPLRYNQQQLVGFGTPCGRVVAIENRAHTRRYDDRLGFFGFFESVGDQSVADALLQAATDRLRERGLDAMRGPVNPSLNYECGLLIDGFDSSPVFMMTYNRPYYAQLLESFGLKRIQDLYAYWGHVSMVPRLSEKHAAMHRAVIERFNIHVRPIEVRRFRNDIRVFLELYNASLAGTWGFVPLSAAELRSLAGSLQHLIVPELTRVAEIDGQPIGALLGLPDYNPRVRAIDGRLFPWGFWKLLYNRRAIRRIRFITANVRPEYQMWGVGLMLMREFLEPVLDAHIEEVEFSWVLESNHLSRQTLEKGGAKRYKTYRIYEASF